MTTRKVYLGDAVYAEYDGYHIILTTEDGIRTTNRIALEPSVYFSLRGYVDEVILPAETERITKAKQEPS